MLVLPGALFHLSVSFMADWVPYIYIYIEREREREREREKERTIYFINEGNGISTILFYIQPSDETHRERTSV